MVSLLNEVNKETPEERARAAMQETIAATRKAVATARAETRDLMDDLFEEAEARRAGRRSPETPRTPNRKKKKGKSKTDEAPSPKSKKGKRQ